jgi:hypothetical protein
VTTTRICDGILQWLPTPVQQFSLFTTTPVQRLSLHPYNDSPSSQWLPSPVQRFSLFTMTPYPAQRLSLHLCNDSPSSTQWLPTPVRRFSLFTMTPYPVQRFSLMAHTWQAEVYLLPRHASEMIFTMAPYTCATISLFTRFSLVKMAPYTTILPHDLFTMAPSRPIHDGSLAILPYDS